jgi:RimJ/RimL family protein N-acetyltransferase
MADELERAIVPTAASPLIRTERVQLHEASMADGAFFLRLLNEPSWIANIGDRKVRCIEDAQEYIKTRIRSQYELYGYGMYVIRLTSTFSPIGICGLIKREYLSAPDLGFALLPDYVGAGYASEAARALCQHAKSQWKVEGLYAFAKADNRRSIHVLERLGFARAQPYALPDGTVVELYRAD